MLWIYFPSDLVIAQYPGISKEAGNMNGNDTNWSNYKGNILNQSNYRNWLKEIVKNHCLHTTSLSSTILEPTSDIILQLLQTESPVQPGKKKMLSVTSTNYHFYCQLMLLNLYLHFITIISCTVNMSVACPAKIIIFHLTQETNHFMRK